MTANSSGWFNVVPIYTTGYFYAKNQEEQMMTVIDDYKQWLGVPAPSTKFSYGWFYKFRAYFL